MNKVQEGLNELCKAVCKDVCKYTAEVNGRNLLEFDSKDAMSDEEFDTFTEAHCFHCPIMDYFDE